MKIYSKKNVYDAALDRIRYLFDEFPNVVVGFSGGKDSSVTLDLALKVAEEKNRLPLSVLFIDQEAEWKGTVDCVEAVMNDKRVKPYWFQMPMVITNNASSYNRYSYCWKEEEKDKWIHPQNEMSIKENKYGTDRFHDLFTKIFDVEFSDQKSCYLSGVRAQEAPKRALALTDMLTYKWITWGKVLSKRKEHYTFYPLYDWSYTDIWKYINENNIEYNKIYDALYRHGVPINEMRISNLHHETAIKSLLLVQEIEPETWNKLVDRIDGASSIKHIKQSSFTCPKVLPNMFKDWEEYAIYLADNIIQEDENREKLYRHMSSKGLQQSKDFYSNFSPALKTAYWKMVINTILSSDWDFTKLTNFAIMPEVMVCRRFYQKEWSRINWKQNSNNKYFTDEQRLELIKQCVNYEQQK
jgi:predicted phosphoadenosine phosphosulfate sulfurtransferase